MKANSLCLMLAAFLSEGAYGQAVMEHAAAAAGASVGTGGGKVLSNMLDKALSKAADAGTKAATAPQPEDKTASNPAIASSPAPNSASNPMPSSKGAIKRSRASRSAAAMPYKPAFAAPGESMAAAMAPPPPSAEDFAKVKEGGARQEVFAALGTPSSHITIPDEGHLIEIMTYSDGGRRLGSVRLDNGQVVSVSTADR